MTKLIPMIVVAVVITSCASDQVMPPTTESTLLLEACLDLELLLMDRKVENVLLLSDRDLLGFTPADRTDRKEEIDRIGDNHRDALYKCTEGGRNRGDPALMSCRGLLGAVPNG